MLHHISTITILYTFFTIKVYKFLSTLVHTNIILHIITLYALKAYYFFFFLFTIFTRKRTLFT